MKEFAAKTTEKDVFMINSLGLYPPPKQIVKKGISIRFFSHFWLQNRINPAFVYTPISFGLKLFGAGRTVDASARVS